MKQAIVLFLSLMINYTVAQDCAGPEHSVNVNDSWISCAEFQNPNPGKSNSHWVLYDLGYVYHIGTTHIWNYNIQGKTEDGMKEISVDYSKDGAHWTELGSWELDEATGNSNYEGEAGPDFGGIACRYILITTNETWGGDCAGLSELRFDISETVGIAEAIKQGIDIRLFPNPTNNIISLETDYPFSEMIVTSVLGYEVLRGAFKKRIDVSFLPPGTYILQLLDKDGRLATKKFVKHKP